MDWENLRFFVELARSGSLSAASRHLRVDHTTVARRISVLEADLGVRLFDRMPRGYALTEAGERVADLAARLEEDAFAIERFARGHSDAPSGAVRLSAPPVVASAFLAPRLVSFRRRFPRVVLELIGDSRAVSLNRREADLAVRLAAPEDGRLIARRLGDMAYALYADAGYAAERPETAWEFVAYNDSLNHVPQQHWLLREAGGRPVVFRANDLASLYAAARAGIGVAALPRFLGDPDPGLVRLPAATEPTARELWLLVHPDVRRAAAVRAAMDTVIGLFAENRDLLKGA